MQLLLESPTQELLIRAEKKVSMSYAEFLEQTDEDTHAEWVNEETIFFMPPTTSHQKIIKFLLNLLGLYIGHFRLGEILTAPVEMKATPNSPSREPDVLFVASQNLARITDRKIEGPADLIIEVISTESVARDRDEKFAEYEAIGVREYWLIDPRGGRERTDFYVLDQNGRYRPVPLNERYVYTSTILPNFWFDTNWLWRQPMIEPLHAFAQIVGFDAVIASLQRMRDEGRV